MSKHHPRVVILGGGFGGLRAARQLRGVPVRITLVDRRNHHVFQPLLYQVATAGLSPADIAEPIRSILRRQKNVEVVLAEATAIDADQQVVELADGSLPYDYLIVATGVTHTYFGKDWAGLAPGLKTLEDAVTIRRRFLMAFEQAEREPSAERRRELLTFVIVGGGPTGVELAGTMAEMAFRSMPGDFRTVTRDDARVLLVEAGSRLLSAYTERSSSNALRALRDRGVEVRLAQSVTEIEGGTVHLGDEAISCQQVFWAAGVAAGPLLASLNAETDRQGRIKVAADCSVPEAPEVFVVGDAASLVDGKGTPVPGVAQGALQMGSFVGKVIAARVAGVRPPEVFVYFNKGQMATIGRTSAVAEIMGLRFSGCPAWLLWLFVHLLFLIGFDNRVIVLTQWAWEYVTFKRGSRLITRDYRESD